MGSVSIPGFAHVERVEDDNKLREEWTWRKHDVYHRVTLVTDRVVGGVLISEDTLDATDVYDFGKFPSNVKSIDEDIWWSRLRSLWRIFDERKITDGHKANIKLFVLDAMEHIGRLESERSSDE